MTAEAWTQAYRDAWHTFYSKNNLIKILARWSHHPAAYWNLLFLYLWYKNAALIEREHPMIAGFYELKDRRTRQPGFTSRCSAGTRRETHQGRARLIRSWLASSRKWRRSGSRPARAATARRPSCGNRATPRRDLAGPEDPQWQQACTEARVALRQGAGAAGSGRRVHRHDHPQPQGPGRVPRAMGTRADPDARDVPPRGGKPGSVKHWLDLLAHLPRRRGRRHKCRNGETHTQVSATATPSRLHLLYGRIFDVLSARVVYSEFRSSGGSGAGRGSISGRGGSGTSGRCDWQSPASKKSS